MIHKHHFEIGDTLKFLQTEMVVVQSFTPMTISADINHAATIKAAYMDKNGKMQMITFNVEQIAALFNKLPKPQAQ